VRSLILRLTFVAAVLAALVSAGITAATQAPWPVILLRASIAFVIVSFVGIVFGLILMRTALRRYYEQHRAVEPRSRRARGER
jgi:hypothetical protein